MAKPKISGHGLRVLYAIAHKTGITVADIKRITPTHIETWSHRTIEHGYDFVKETIDMREFSLA